MSEGAPLPPSQVPHFPETYDKSRRAYGFAAALLLGWELVGIDVPEQPLENVKVILKSPQAVPYILIVLVLYFGFRHSIEWGQAEPDRRNRTISRLDFLVSHVIGATSVVVFVVQSALRLQLIEVAMVPSAQKLYLLFVLGITLRPVYRFAFLTRPEMFTNRWLPRIVRSRPIGWFVAIVFTYAVGVWIIGTGPYPWWAVFVGLAGFLVELLGRRWLKHQELDRAMRVAQFLKRERETRERAEG